MKLKLEVLSLALACIYIMSSFPAQAASSTPVYLGETTWSVNQTQNENGPTNKTFSVTGSLTKVGGTYYLFQGCVANTGGDNPFFLSGGGNLINNQLIMTLSTSQLHVTDLTDNSQWRDTGVMQITVNTAAGANYLCGTFYEVGHDFNAATTGQTGFDQRFSSGSLTLTGSQIPLNPATTAPANALLLQ